MNYRINRLINAGVVEKGPKFSYREVYIKEDIKTKLKEEITEFKEGHQIPAIKMCVHHIAVLFPIVENKGVNFGIQRKRWKSKLTEKIIIHERLFFRVELTNKNLIVRFPSQHLFELVSFEKKVLIRLAKSYCFSIAEEIKKQLNFGEKLNLGKPKLTAHWAFSDNCSQKIVNCATTVVEKRGKSWVSVDKSPHFTPKGEVETNNVVLASNYIDLICEWPKTKKMLIEYKSLIHEKKIKMLLN